MTLPRFPFTEVKAVTSWSNFHGTIRDRPIPVYCAPDVIMPSMGDLPRSLRRHGDAVRAIIRWCFEQAPPMRLRVLGSSWSLSSIIEPEEVVIDPGNLNGIVMVNPDWLSDAYRSTRYQQGYRPVLVEGGTQVARINRRLAEIGLALQTSGAADGHRIAGCIATGTHGAAIDIGAVHDTTLALHMVTGPDESKFIQPDPAIFRPEVAEWLELQTGLPTDDLPNDALLEACRVSLGSLGFVFGVVIEAAPLYLLDHKATRRHWRDPEIWEAMATWNTTPLHPTIDRRPYHFSMNINPYRQPNDDGVFVSLKFAHEPMGGEPVVPTPATPATSSSTMELLMKVSEALDDVISRPILSAVLGAQLDRELRETNAPPRPPGLIFGPTTIPPGFGESSEIIVSCEHVQDAVRRVDAVIKEESLRGNHFLGPIAVRFVPATRATLGMNVFEKNAFIELPSIQSNEIRPIMSRCFDELERARIPFTCHWGQYLELNPGRLRRFFGGRVDDWCTARARILPSETARTIFGSRLLEDVGLDRIAAGLA